MEMASEDALNPEKKKRFSLTLKKKPFAELSELAMSSCKKKDLSVVIFERVYQWALNVFELWIQNVPNAEVSDLWEGEKRKYCNLYFISLYSRSTPS